MKSVIYVLFGICWIFQQCSAAAINADTLNSQWEEFKVQHHKTYPSLEEENLRKEIFKNNLELIQIHNEKYENKEVTFKMGINKFTDLTSEEHKKYLGLIVPDSSTTEWEEYKLQYNKIYSSDVENKLREEIFQKNLQLIKLHNEKYEKKEVTWKMGVNIFTDLTSEEKQQYTGLKHPDNLSVQWEQFKDEFGKLYPSNEEDQLRKEIFRKNLELIKVHNEKYEKKEVTFKMGINKFTDLTSEEHKKYLGLIVPDSSTTEWEEYKLQYNKIYSSDVENKLREEIFQKNLQLIKLHNEKYEKKEVTWKMGVNIFTDLTSEEKQQYTGLKHPDNLSVQWEQFKDEFGKLYPSNEEDQLRKEIFRKNLELIKVHNEKYEKKEVTFKMGINKFTDLTSEEHKKYLGLIVPNSSTTEWEEYKLQYNKIYSSDVENKLREEIFKKNLQLIKLHNEKYEKKEVTWKMGVNIFTDLTSEEKQQYTGLKHPDNLSVQWEQFKDEFGKLYPSNEEDQLRKEIFRKNLELIKVHNEKYEKKEVTFKMGINKFTDLTSEEFRKQTGGIISGLGNKLSQGLKIESTVIANTTTDLDDDVPDDVDWYKYGFKTSVMHQGSCGSCYAMGVAGAIEARWYIKYKEFIRVSQQELVDCTISYGNHGCQYGDLATTFKYVMENGVGSFETNKYLARVTECRQEYPRYNISNWYQTKAEDEEDLKRAVAKGPVIVVVNAGLDSFKQYTDGVYYEENCKIDPYSVNHFLLVLGYGTNENGEDYWFLKNSWGPYWGLNGYMYLARNRGNQCGVATEAMYPVVA